MDTLRRRFPLNMMCRVLQVSRSGFYAWRQRPPSERSGQEGRLQAEIQAAHERTRRTYGPERLQRDPAAHGVRVGVHRIKRIRRQLGPRRQQKRRFRVTTDSRHALPVAPNVLGQCFRVQCPNQAWVGDITYVATDEGWLYLAGLKDLHSGRIVRLALRVIRPVFGNLIFVGQHFPFQREPAIGMPSSQGKSSWVGRRMEESAAGGGKGYEVILLLIIVSSWLAAIRRTKVDL